MSLPTLYWTTLLLWFGFVVWNNWPVGRKWAKAEVKTNGWHVLLFLLLLILGWHVLGPPIHK